MAKSAVPAWSLRPSSPSGQASRRTPRPGRDPIDTRRHPTEDVSPRPSAPTAYAPGQSTAAHTNSGPLSSSVTGAACSGSRLGTAPTRISRPSSLLPHTKHSLKSGSSHRRAARARPRRRRSRRRRRFEVDDCGPRLGDDRFAVEQDSTPSRRVRRRAGVRAAAAGEASTSTSSASTNAARRPHA